MDFTFPATTTAAAPTTAPGELPAAAGPSAPAASSSACRHLPFPRFAAARSPLRFPRSPPPAPAAMAEQEPRPPEKKRAGAGGDAASSSSAAEDRMDLLWEDFNEELAQASQRRARRGGSWRERDDGGLLVLEDPWSESPPSDAESEPAARGYVPVLRPSSRAAGGARHCRGRAGSWVLLMRIFRRLFVVEKTFSVAAVARQRSQRSTTSAR